jgi:hypothetical protein
MSRVSMTWFLAGTALLYLNATATANTVQRVAGRVILSCGTLDASGKPLPYPFRDNTCPQILFWFADCAAIENDDPTHSRTYTHCHDREGFRQLDVR